MSEFYLRKASANVNGKLVTNLRMAFKVEKSLKPEANQAELKIWNLSKDSRANLEKDILVSIEAGYQNDTNNIFVGKMRKVDHLRDGPNWITHCRIGDGEKEIKTSRVNTSRKGRVTPTDIIGDLVKALGLKSGNAMDKARQGDLSGAWKELTSGVVLSGNAYEKLTAYATNMGYDVSVQDGALLLLGPDETSAQQSFLLSPSTGLIGSPEQAEKGVIKARSLLNGQMVPGRQVELKSAAFNGSCRIEKVTFLGDTHDTPWFAEIELKRLGQ